jgi:uncharacterized lipoprotein YajG
VELLFVALTVAITTFGSDKALMRKAILFAAILLSGCTTVAKTAVDVVTLPVKVASAGVDAVTTSQSERDEKAGRELRKQDAQRGRLARELQERCRKGKPLPTDDCSATVQR